jgi:hypothetical protein
MHNHLCLLPINQVALLAYVISLLACTPDKPADIAKDEIQALNKAKDTAAQMEELAEKQKVNIDEQAK